MANLFGARNGFGPKEHDPHDFTTNKSSVQNDDFPRWAKPPDQRNLKGTITLGSRHLWAELRPKSQIDRSLTAAPERSLAGGPLMRKGMNMPNYSEDDVLLAERQVEKKTKRKYIDSGEHPSDNDTWFLGTEKLPRASALTLGKVHGVLPFDGIRNPSSRSNTSQKVLIPYRVPANNWVPKVGKAESWGEAATGLEAIMSTNVYDVAFQPCKVEFRDEDGATREYTHDLLVTFRSGHRRLIFVRNEASLQKPRTQRHISAIAAATPKDLADDMIVVNANDYSRQRRENLLRMHHFAFHPDAEADEAVLETARGLRSFYYMKDLFPHAPVPQRRAFAACYRLVARGVLRANLDQVLWENSHIEVAA